MRFSALLLLASVHVAWARDTTVTFTRGYLEGVIRLDARNRVIAPSPDLLQGIRFNLAGKPGPYLFNTGMPDFNASCNGKDFGALVVTPGEFGPAPVYGMGFNIHGNTDWNWTPNFSSLMPLDTLKERFPSHTKRDSIIGRGWIHSADVMALCRTVEHQTVPGYRRIFYYRRGNTGLKVQVDRFETESVDCGNGLPCNRTRYVHLRYAISDSLRFPTGIRTAPARRPAFHPAFPGPIWEYVLGRKARKP